MTTTSKNKLRGSGCVLAGLVALSSFAHAAPITYNFSHSFSALGGLSFLPGEPDPMVVERGRLVSHENRVTPSLPVQLVNFSDTSRFDLSQIVGSSFLYLGGNFSYCSAAGADCVVGTISDFQLQPDNSFARIATVTSGSGAYQGASGGWTVSAAETTTPRVRLYSARGSISINGSAYQVDWSNFLEGTGFFESPSVSVGTWTSFLSAPMLADGLPVPMRSWEAIYGADGFPAGTGDGAPGRFTWCGANGVDCLIGSLVDFAPVPVPGHPTVWTSTAVVTSGSGMYRGATGQWSNQFYFGLHQGSVYDLINIATGSVTLPGAEAPLPPTWLLVLGGLALLMLLNRGQRRLLRFDTSVTSAHRFRN